jgi:hypothetical protein
MLTMIIHVCIYIHIYIHMCWIIYMCVCAFRFFQIQLHVLGKQMLGACTCSNFLHTPMINCGWLTNLGANNMNQKRVTVPKTGNCLLSNNRRRCDLQPFGNITSQLVFFGSWGHQKVPTATCCSARWSTGCLPKDVKTGKAWGMGAGFGSIKLLPFENIQARMKMGC